MVGARPGDRVLVVGVGDAAFAAELALVTGLTGEVRVADHAPGAAAAIDAAVRKYGALVEFDEAPPSRLPFDAGAFDVVVINRQLGELPVADRGAVAVEAIRVAKPGGRIVVIEAGQPTGMLARWSKPRDVLAPDVVRRVLTDAGCRATRVLAEAGGATYVEALTVRT
jgi:demethylmenaquinone methyltransferase/2-methoxy-6-polyprenyl-1,4-benzoquinol methylase